MYFPLVARSYKLSSQAQIVSSVRYFNDIYGSDFMKSLFPVDKAIPYYFFPYILVKFCYMDSQ